MMQQNIIFIAWWWYMYVAYNQVEKTFHNLIYIGVGMQILLILLEMCDFDHGPNLLQGE